jgi:hypothetical protein
MELPAVLVGRGAAAFTQDELPQLHAQAFTSARTVHAMQDARERAFLIQFNIQSIKSNCI